MAQIYNNNQYCSRKNNFNNVWEGVLIILKDNNMGYTRLIEWQ
ncbi:hypothetical protein SAMN05428949_1798 [Chitinophaga sp. YR627]|nr:hypothetical protein SAMN05428949_1798 [Chitinophaga sp. YR627]